MGRPLKPCACGCGEQTTRTYRLGHRPTKSYPAAAVGDRVERIHILRAEKALGRALPHGVEVHHADGSKAADAPLVICPDRAYHRLLHVRMRIQAAGGDPNTQRVCSTCKQLTLIDDMAKHKGQPDRRCKACNRAHAQVHYRSTKHTIRGDVIVVPDMDFA
jgi:hypothetical protein